MKIIYLLCILISIPAISFANNDVIAVQRAIKESPFGHHMTLTFTSKADKLTLNRITVNRGNAKIDCNIDNTKVVMKQAGYYDASVKDSLPIELKFGESWECAGQVENILEVKIETKEFGVMTYGF